MNKRVMKKVMAGTLAFGMMTTSVFGNVSTFADVEVYAAGTETAYATMNVGETTQFQMTAGVEKTYYKFTTDSTDAFYTFTLNVFGTSESGAAAYVYSGSELMDSQKLVDVWTNEGGSATDNVVKDFQPDSTYYVVLENFSDDKTAKGSIVVKQYPDDRGDSVEAATVFKVGTEASGCVENINDVDFLTFTTDGTDSFYGIEVSAIGTEGRLGYDVYDNKELLESGKLHGNVVEYGRKDIVDLKKRLKPNKTYYIKVAGYGEINGDNPLKYTVKIKKYQDDRGDSIAAATVFKVGTEASGCIENINDVDFLTFTTDGTDSFYGIEVSAIGTEGRLGYDVYDNKELLESGKLHGNVVEYGRKDIVDLKKRLKPNKTYYIKVAGYGEINCDNPLKYTVKVKKYQDDKGDSVSSASTLKTGVAGTGNLNNNADVEYYTYTTDSSDSFYSIEVSAIGTEGRLSYDVYDNKSLLDSGFIHGNVVYSGRNDTVNLQKKLQPNKTYYIRVAAYSEINCEKPLKYSVTVKQYKDDVKDVANSAKTVKVGSTVSAALQNGVDIDFFKVTLDKSDAFYTFSFQNVTKAQNVYFQIYKDKNCTECVKDGVVYSKSKATYDLGNTLVPGKTYYIKVTRSDGEINSVSYKFKLTKVKDDVKSAGTSAKKISLNKTYSYKIQNSVDEDWFKLTTSNYTDYIVNCQNITKNAWISIRIYSDKNGVNEIYSKTVNPKSSLASYDKQIKLTPYKTYYIKITGDVASYKVGVSAKGPQNAKVKNAKDSKKKVTVSWSKVNKAKGYEIWKATKNGKFKLVKTFTSAKKVSWTDTSVKKGTTYKYKIRAFAKKGKTKYYSAFSAVKSIKVK